MYTDTFTELVSDTLYTISVVAINCAGASNGASETKWICEYYVMMLLYTYPAVYPERDHWRVPAQGFARNRMLHIGI